MAKKTVSDFDVMKAISERNLDIRMAGISNIIRITKNKKGFKVEIGVDEETGMSLVGNKYVGGLYLMDREQYKKLKSEMEEK